jgi:hypothetical protein
MPKILGGEARGRKKVRMATKWDRSQMGMAKFACRWQAAERVEVRLKETTVGSNQLIHKTRSSKHVFLMMILLATINFEALIFPKHLFYDLTRETMRSSNSPSRPSQ